MSEFKWEKGIAVSGVSPMARHPRLYSIMLQDWFPWRLRRWIERRVLARS